MSVWGNFILENTHHQKEMIIYLCMMRMSKKKCLGFRYYNYAKNVEEVEKENNQTINPNPQPRN